MRDFTLVEQTRVWRSDNATIGLVTAAIGVVGLSAIAIAFLISGPIALGIAVLLASAFGVWRLGWSQAFELAVVDDDLVWRAPFSTGRIPANRLLSYRTAFGQWGTMVILRDDGRRLLVWKGNGLQAFLATELHL